MKTPRSLIVFGFLLSGVGCAHHPPAELVNARAAYARANSGTAAKVVPAEVHKARTALDVAERNFADEHDTQKTRDLAYIAERKAETAEALGAAQASANQEASAQRSLETQQAALVQKTQSQLGQTKQQLATAQQTSATSAQQLESEKAARAAAEADAQQARDALTKLAAKEEARGSVITLSGSVLFRSNESVLLPDSQTRLNEVAGALLASKNRNVVVEGHTDSRGSAGLNQSLSQRRAESVRDYIVSRGFPSERIEAKGVGADRPIADNNMAEGRANNRRVEIVVQPAHTVSSTP